MNQLDIYNDQINLKTSKLKFINDHFIYSYIGNYTDQYNQFQSIESIRSLKYLRSHFYIKVRVDYDCDYYRFLLFQTNQKEIKKIKNYEVDIEDLVCKHKRVLYLLDYRIWENYPPYRIFRINDFQDLNKNYFKNIQKSLKKQICEEEDRKVFEYIITYNSI